MLIDIAHDRRIRNSGIGEGHPAKRRREFNRFVDQKNDPQGGAIRTERNGEHDLRADLQSKQGSKPRRVTRCGSRF